MATITKVEQQRKDTSRFSIFIDHQFAFALSGVDVLYYKLKEGCTLSEDQYQTLLDQVIYIKAKDKAIRFLGCRMRSIMEMKEKLSADYSPTTIEKVIAFLLQYKYLDDRLYALSFIKDKTKLKKDGRKKIYYELKGKGISEDILQEVFDSYDFKEADMIQLLLEKKLKNSTAINEKERKRAIDYLLRKGFSWSVIQEGLEIYFMQQMEKE